MKSKTEESEYTMHQGELIHRYDGLYVPSDDDSRNKVRHHDDEQFWTVESYNPKVIRRMVELGAIDKRSLHDGRLFVCNAKQVIEFIAASSGLNVEFRPRKRPQLSNEQIEARRLRMAAINAKQRAKI